MLVIRRENFFLQELLLRKQIMMETALSNVMMEQHLGRVVTLLWVKAVINIGQDCNDSDVSVYVGAEEVCDGQVNDCEDSGSVPADELDKDEDGYIQCDVFYGDYDCRCSSLDSNNNPTDCSLNGDGVVSCTPDNQSASIFWFDSSPPDGGSDCDDNDVTRYPTAAEICDGRFNDCINPLLDPFEGVTGDDCYCTDFTSGDCIDSNGDT